jgi:hypothetical protein
MLKALLVLSVVMSGSAFAQNMASSEQYRDAYVDMPDGSSRYVGKCSTHEDYDKFYFKSKKVVQKYVEPSDMTPAQIKTMLAKFDKGLITQILKVLQMDDIAGENVDQVTIFKDYIDDISATTVAHEVFPDLNLIRFSVGVGGGNGGYLVFNQSVKGTKTTYDLMSYTFDSDLNYCDKKVWLQNN